MSYQDMIETEASAGRWLGRAIAVCGIVIVAFWIGGNV